MDLLTNPLKEWREAVGHSQSSLGAAVGGATDKTVRSWENSLTVIQPRYRRPLAAALGKDIAEIVAVVRFIESAKAAESKEDPAPSPARQPGDRSAIPAAIERAREMISERLPAGEDPPTR